MIKTPIQLRFADIDMLGHVNNVNLQHYFDVGKFAFYREVLGQDGTMPSSESLVLAQTATNYYAQTRLTDEVYVTTAVEKIGDKSVTFFQQLVNAKTGAVNADCRTVAVGFDFTAQQTIALLPAWRDALENEKLRIEN